MTALVAVFALAALATPATAATPTERKLSRQIKTMQRQVKVLQGQVTTLRRQMREVQGLATGGIIFTACHVAATADAFQGTWETIDQINPKVAEADKYPPIAPIADPLNSCADLEIQRQPNAVPPTVNVFAALLNLFR